MGTPHGTGLRHGSTFGRPRPFKLLCVLPTAGVETPERLIILGLIALTYGRTRMKPCFDYNGVLQQQSPHAPRAAGGHQHSTYPDRSLIEREQEIILLVGQALSNKDSADRLYISSTTVRHHLTRIFGKLDVHSRQQLLIRAHKYGLVKLHANGTAARARLVAGSEQPA